jgi:hypothetical protein
LFPITVYKQPNLPELFWRKGGEERNAACEDKNREYTKKMAMRRRN